MVTTYHLRADDLWDIWESLLLQHSLDIFAALRKACSSSEKLCFLIVFLQLGEVKSHASGVGNVRVVLSYFPLEGVPELA